MFIGHWAPAMIAATHKDAPSLPVLFVAIIGPAVIQYMEMK